MVESEARVLILLLLPVVVVSGLINVDEVEGQ